MHGPYLLMSVKPPKRKMMEMRRVEFMMLFFFSFRQRESPDKLPCSTYIA